MCVGQRFPSFAAFFACVTLGESSQTFAKLLRICERTSFAASVVLLSRFAARDAYTLESDTIAGAVFLRDVFVAAFFDVTLRDAIVFSLSREVDTRHVTFAHFRRISPRITQAIFIFSGTRDVTAWRTTCQAMCEHNITHHVTSRSRELWTRRFRGVPTGTRGHSRRIWPKWWTPGWYPVFRVPHSAWYDLTMTWWNLRRLERKIDKLSEAIDKLTAVVSELEVEEHAAVEEFVKLQGELEALEKKAEEGGAITADEVNAITERVAAVGAALKSGTPTV
jgi:hypothetical protein